jgi:hypothetical protein
MHFDIENGTFGAKYRLPYRRTSSHTLRRRLARPEKALPRKRFL